MQFYSRVFNSEKQSKNILFKDPENLTELCVETWWKIIKVSEKIRYKGSWHFFALLSLLYHKPPYVSLTYVLSAVCVKKL
jgi:hypothetical protein